MNLAELVDRALGERLHGVARHRVGDDADDPVLLLLQLPHGGLQRLLFNVGQDDLHPLASEALREGAAHSAGGAGHDRGLTIEVTHC